MKIPTQGSPAASPAFGEGWEIGSGDIGPSWPDGDGITSLAKDAPA